MQAPIRAFDTYISVQFHRKKDVFAIDTTADGAYY